MEAQFISNKPGPEGRYPINLYLISEAENGRMALRKTPGLIGRVTPDDTTEVRGAITMGGNLYTVCGNTFYLISSAWAATSKGTLNTSTGFISMAASDTYVVIVDSGGDAYYYSVAVGTLTQITDGDFPSSVNFVTYQDGYFIFTRTDSKFFVISAIDDPSQYDPADTDEVEGKAGYLKAVISDSRRVWFFSQKSLQVYYNSGNADFPFEPIQGSYQEIGIGAPDSVALMGQSVYFLDNFFRIVRTVEFGHQVISTEQIQKKIASYSNPETARGYCVYWQGHPWYVIVFPNDGKTWVFDAALEYWFQWSSGSESGRHRSNCYVWWQEQKKHVMGDFETGEIFELDKSTYTDDGESILWERVAPVVYQDGKNIRFDSVQIDMKVGVGLITGHGIDNAEDPQVILDWSNDDGQTWSNEHYGSYGAIGEYSQRVKFNRLGMARRRTFRLRGSESTEIEIYSAFLNAQAGRS